MGVTAFEDTWRGGARVKPKILVLEVRDRKGLEPAPLCWLMVEREETCQRDPRDGEVFRASIRLSYQCIAARSGGVIGRTGFFDGSYSRLGNVVSLTSPSISRGGLFLDLPGLEGQRIGTYLMNQVVGWVRQWPGAQVHRVELLAGQATEDNKARRNWFYEQFGLEFDYADDEHKEGVSRPMLASELCEVPKWQENITEIRVMDYLAGVVGAAERAQSELAASERARNNLKDERDRIEAHPMRWALRRLYYGYVPHMLGIAAILGLSGLAWLRHG